MSPRLLFDTNNPSTILNLIVMANENQNEQALDPRVAERLDKIDWDGLLRITGIRREQIEGNPTVARQLAYQQYTDLVYGNTADISGQFSLRAVPGREPDEAWRVKAYTIEREKTVNDDIFLYGSPITSKKAKEALFERTSWENSEGKRVVGRANANAGRPIAIERDVDGERRKDYYLVSLHEPTNRVIGIPVDAVRRMFFDENERAREVSIYGARLSAEQLDEICKGNHVLVDGCRNSKGEEFSTFVQFDVARRQLVPTHPAILKEAQRVGVDLLGSRKEAPAQEPARARERKAGQAPVPQPEGKPRMRHGR